MKKTITILLTLCLSAFSLAQNVNIPDANFKAYLVGNSAINTNNDTEISVAEAEAFTGTIDCGWKNISDLTGIKAFVNLTKLDCRSNSLTSLDVSGLSNLTELHCYYNSLTSLNVSGLSNLTVLNCFNNSLTSICISESHNTSNWYKDDKAEWTTSCQPLALSETQSTEKAQILKAYNLQGQEVPVNTKGEVIILLYDNGVREKTYVAE